MLPPHLVANHTLISNGTHCSLAWAVGHNRLGFRVGYVCAPKNTPEEKINEIYCHGGITFDKLTDDGRWIGFDCCHFNDAPDPSLPGYERMTLLGAWPGEIRSTAYCEEQCKSICEQLTNQPTKETK